jgi:hypothetical protein
MVPDTCSLSESELDQQIQRYRAFARGAREVRRDGPTVEVTAGPAVTDALVEELVATERSCCPFLSLDWDAAGRRLRIAAVKPSDEPVLELIAGALGVPAR